MGAEIRSELKKMKILLQMFSGIIFFINFAGNDEEIYFIEFRKKRECTKRIFVAQTLKILKKAPGFTP